MAQATRSGRSRGRISLPVRLSLLILFAALVPVAAVVGITTFRAREALTQQGQDQLASDANSKAALVDSYVYERMQDGQALATLVTVAPFVLCETLPQPPDALGCSTQLNKLYLPSNQRALAVGLNRDCNYPVWSIFDGRGDPLLAFRQNQAKGCSGDPEQMQTSDVSPVPASDLQAVMTLPSPSQSYVSPVYYDGKHAYIQLYAPIFFATPQGKGVIGFLRATLNLDYVVSIVGHEGAANGSGSEAFITDQDGIRIASSNAQELFTSVKPLSADALQAIESQKRFGTNTAPPVVDLPDVAASLSNGAEQQTFQSIASPSSALEYQFVRIKLDKLQLDRTDASGSAVAVPLTWSYFVLSPTTTVTQIASDEVRYSLFIAGVIAILALLIGLFMGTRITKPVQRSVADLEGAAIRLHGLASQQQESSGEQHWVVDACQTGLESVRYLSDAMHQAARRVLEASNWFSDYWDRLTEEQVRRTVQHLQELAHYIDEAAKRQQASSDRLGKAITVTRQVSDQLVSGASAAAESANQLEEVVHDLHQVVGGRARELSLAETVEEAQMPNMPVGVPGGSMPGFGGRYPNPPSQVAPNFAPAFPPGFSQVFPPSPNPRQPAGSRVPRNSPSGWADYAPGMGQGMIPGSNGNGNGYGGYGDNGYSGNGSNGSGYSGNGNSGWGNGNSGWGAGPDSGWGPPSAWGNR